MFLLVAAQGYLGPHPFQRLSVTEDSIGQTDLHLLQRASAECTFGACSERKSAANAASASSNSSFARIFSTSRSPIASSIFLRILNLAGINRATRAGRPDPTLRSMPVPSALTRISSSGFSFDMVSVSIARLPKPQLLRLPWQSLKARQTFCWSQLLSG